MSAADSKVRELSPQERQELDERLSDFHRTWGPDRLDHALQDLPADLPYRLAAVTGLAAIDLEMQWQNGKRPRVEEYLERYPELGTSENVSIELLLSEFLSQERTDAKPDLNSFLARFPQQADDLRRLISLARSPRLSGIRSRSGGKSIHSEEGEVRPDLPEQFDRYRIQKKLGQGGMGTVYLAYDTRLDRKVALKVPRFAPGSNPENLERFYREARATATITHPNLCPLFDVGEINSTPYLTMAFIEGWPLSKFIRPDKLLPQFGVATVVRIVAQAIEEAHKHGVIHRDLKPGNIMINKRGEPIVMDFGLARWVNADKEDVRLTRSGAILGAPVYMSPEQVYGDVDAMGPGCDVYSLGVILYELLTGRLPFDGPTTAVLAKTLIQPPKPPSAYRPDVDPRLEAICLKAMAKKITERYQSMGELAAALTEYIRAERQAQTLTSLSQTKIPGNGAQSGSSADIGGGLSGKIVGSPSSKSGRGRSQATTATINVAPGGTKPDLDDEAPLAAEEVPAVRRDVALPKPQGSRMMLWAALAGGGLFAALLLAGLLTWWLWPKAKGTPGPAASAMGSIRLSLSDMPDDVEVRVNDEFIDRARLAAPLSLKPGDYNVVVKSSKYETWRQTVRVNTGVNASLDVTLRPKDGAIIDVKGKDPQPGVPFEGHGGAVKSVAWSRDGRFILSGGEDGSLRLWDAITREVKQSFDGHRKAVTGVGLSADGNRALSGDEDGAVILWDVPTGHVIHRLGGNAGPVRAVAIASDGKWGLSGGDDRTLRLWDLDKGELTKSFPGHDGTIWAVAFSRDAKRAASGGDDRAVRVWDLEKLAELKQLRGHIAAVRGVAFLPDGRILSCSDDRTLRLWEPTTALTLKVFTGHADKVRGVAVSSDGKRAVSAGHSDGNTATRDNTLRVWDVNKGTMLYGLGTAPQGNDCVAFAPNDRWVISGGEDKLIRLWDSLKASTVPLPSPPLDERILEVRQFGAPKHGVSRVAVSHDGQFALSAGYDGTVRYWNLTQGRELLSIPAHEKGARYVVFSDDDRQALSCGDDKRACLWDLGTGKLVKEYTGHAAQVWIALFTPDGKGVLTGAGNDDNKARLFDIEGGAPRKQFKDHTKAVNSLAISPDGKKLVTAGWDSTLRVWDVDQEKELHAFKVPTGNFSTVTFLQDGRRVVAANGSKVKLYDVVGFKELGSFDNGHKDPVWFAAVSPGGHLLLTSGQDHYICLWDIESRKLLLKYNGHTDSVAGVAFTPDGTRFLSGSKDATMRLWELPRNLYDPPPLPVNQEAKDATLLQPATKDPRNYVEQVAFTADGKRALWCGDDKLVHVCDLANNKELLKFDKHTNGVRTFALLSDGRRVLSASYDNTVRLWELDTGKEIRKFTHPKRVQTVTVTSDGKRAISGGDDNTMFVWDVDSGNELKKLVGHEKAVFTVAVTPDDKEAISGAMDKTIRRWNLETGKEVAKWTAPGDVHTLAISPDGRRVLSGGKDMNVTLWDRESGEVVSKFVGHTHTITCVRFSPDGRWALSGSDDKTARLWNVETGQEMVRFTGCPASTKGVAFSPDARVALVGGADTSVRLWTLPDFTAPVPVSSLRTFTAAGPIERVAISPNGRLALSAGADKAVRLWDLADGAQQKSYDWHADAVHDVCFSPDGRLAASCGNDHFAVVGNVDSGAPVQRLDHGVPVWAAAFSTDGKRLLTGCDNSAEIWDIAGGSSVQTFKGHAGRVTAVAWAPDGNHIVTASLDGTLRLWDASTGKELKRYEGHTGGVAAVAVSPNGHYVVSGGLDKTVRLWNLESARLLHIFDGHTDEVCDVAFSPDGRRILSGSKDRSMKLWDMDDRRLLHSYDGHTDAVTGVAFHPDGRRALSGSLDKTMRLWGLPVY
jgi:WD40 repeat protein/serine/threonine protein kinase